MEDLSNIYTTCPKHSSHPQTKYAFWNLNDFIGKWIKMEFAERGTDRKEHLWILIQSIKNEKTLTGMINNDPMLDLGVVDGDIVEVPVSKIEACFDGKNML